MMISIGQAARILGVTPATARRWTEIGLLSCERTAGGHRRVAREDVVELARAIGDSNQVAVRRARERELETLVEASVAVAGHLDQSTLLPEIAKYVTLLCRCDTCSISSYSAETQTVTVLAEYDAGGRREMTSGVYDLRDYPATLHLLTEQVPEVFNIDDRRLDPAERRLLVQSGDKSTLALPLVHQGRTIGLLEAVDANRTRTYSRQELRLVGALASHAAVALRNAELYRQAATADAAIAGLRTVMRDISTRISQAEGTPERGNPLQLLANALRDSLDAVSVVITRDGVVAGAAVRPRTDSDRATAGEDGPASDVPRRVRRPAHVSSAAVDLPGGCLEVTMVTAMPPVDGHDELLELALAVAALPASPA